MNRTIGLGVAHLASPAALRVAACIPALFCLGLLLAPRKALAQVTIDTRTGAVTNPTTGDSAGLDRRFQQITPTHVPLSNNELDPKTRLLLIRQLQSEQGFAMRPFPRGHKGLTLEANGKLDPAGQAYLETVISEGLSANPGDRLVVTDVRIDRDRIVLLLNGGPEGRHRFLRHIQLGSDGPMTPVVRDDGQPVTGSRLTLAFPHHIPELTAAQVKALLAPLISFDVKTPIQAFTDTLPAPLEQAILSHHVLVGMTVQMLLFTKGEPDIKYHDIQGNMPFDEWIYGKPPHDVEFVRINGNRVIRDEIAKIGKEPVVYTADVVDGMMRSGGMPVTLDAANAPHLEKLGDVHPDPHTSAATPPPTLGGDADSGYGVPNPTMKPVIFPKQQPEPQLGSNPDGVPSSPPPANPPSNP